MIDIGKFAKPHDISQKNGFFRFGLVDSKTFATTLREMADAVENDEIVIQKVQGGQIAVPDDWLHQAIFIEFVEKEKVNER